MLVIEDNGVGMNKYVIENCFMKVGRSYYRSNEFARERAEFKKLGVDFEPAAQFGIGIMSCFMIADRFEVDSLRTNLKNVAETPLIVDIEGPDRFFVVRQGERKSPGTKIALHLKKKIPWQDWLREYAVHVEFPIKIGKNEVVRPSKFNPDAYRRSMDRSIYERPDLVTLLMAKSKLKTYKIDLSEVVTAREHGLKGKINIYFFQDSEGLPCFANQYLTIYQDCFRMRFRLRADRRDSAYESMLKFLQKEGELQQKELTTDDILRLEELERMRRYEFEERRSIDRSLTYHYGLASCDGIKITERSLLGLDLPHSYDIDMSGELRPDVNVTKDDFVDNERMERFRQIIAQIIAKHIIADIKKGRFFPKGVLLTQFLKDMSSNDQRLGKQLMDEVQLVNEILTYCLFLEDKLVHCNLQKIISEYKGQAYAFGQKVPKKFRHKLIIQDDKFPNRLLFNIGELTVYTSKDVDESYLEVNLHVATSVPREEIRLAHYKGYHSSAFYANNLAKALNIDHKLVKIYIALKSKSAGESSILEDFEDFLRISTTLPADTKSKDFVDSFKELKKDLGKLKKKILETQLLDKGQTQSMRITLKDFGAI